MKNIKGLRRLEETTLRLGGVGDFMLSRRATAVTEDQEHSFCLAFHLLCPAFHLFFTFKAI